MYLFQSIYCKYAAIMLQLCYKYAAKKCFDSITSFQHFSHTNLPLFTNLYAFCSICRPQSCTTPSVLKVAETSMLILALHITPKHIDFCKSYSCEVSNECPCFTESNDANVKLIAQFFKESSYFPTEGWVNSWTERTLF